MEMANERRTFDLGEISVLGFFFDRMVRGTYSATWHCKSAFRIRCVVNFNHNRPAFHSDIPFSENSAELDSDDGSDNWPRFSRKLVWILGFRYRFSVMAPFFHGHTNLISWCVFVISSWADVVSLRRSW
jgi:hypothetical protein